MPATEPLSKYEFLMIGRQFCIPYVVMLAAEMRKRGMHLDVITLSFMGRAAIQAFVAGGMAADGVLNTQGRSIKLISEITHEDVDAFIHATGGMDSAEAIREDQEDKAQMQKG